MNNSGRNNNGTNNNSNNNNNFGGKMIMTNGTIRTMEAFAGTVKSAMEAVYPEARVMVQDIVKTNDTKLTGLTIVTKQSNMSPTIYLEEFFDDYKNGRTMADIVCKIRDIYEQNCQTTDFPVDKIMDYEAVKDRICVKLINTERNQLMLVDTPHLELHDLAIVFYILLQEVSDGTATVVVKNHMIAAWGITDVQELYKTAIQNTQILLGGTVHNMFDVMADIISHSENVDADFVEQFFQMDNYEDNAVPMYVATNRMKLNGASVILYTGLLKRFSEKIGGDFFILPSSIHETLFVPAFGDMDARELVMMVREVNATEVSPEEVLSDNVYRYNADLDLVEMM